MTATLPSPGMINSGTRSVTVDGSVSLRELAAFTGLAVAAEPAVDLALGCYKYLEIIRNRELARHHGDYGTRV